MSQTNKILIGLLVAQAILLAVTWSSDIGRGGGEDGESLVPFAADTITRLEVVKKAEDGKDPENVVLLKEGDGWIVDGTDEFPADPDKVSEVLEKLTKASRKDPLVRNRANHNALNVGPRTYEKQVILDAGDQKTTLTLGTAKGTSVHVRVDDGDEVFLARGISVWGVGHRVDTYVDTQYAVIEEPTEIAVTNKNGTINLKKNDEGTWLVAELRPDQKTDVTRIRSFVNQARSLRLVEPLGKTIKPEYGLEAGARVMVKNAEKTLEYRIGNKDGDHVYVKATDNPYVVKMRAFSVESLLNQTPDKFIEEPPLEVPAPGSQPMGMPGMPPGMPGMPPGMQMPPPQR